MGLSLLAMALHCALPFIALVLLFIPGLTARLLAQSALAVLLLTCVAQAIALELPITEGVTNLCKLPLLAFVLLLIPSMATRILAQVIVAVILINAVIAVGFMATLLPGS